MVTMDIKKIIEKRMAELELTPYALGEKLKGKIPQRSIYNFLKEGRSPSLETLGLILDTLRLTIRPQ